VQSIIIVAPKDYDWDFKMRLERLCPVTLGADGVMVVEDGCSRIYVARDDSVGLEMEPDCLQHIESLIAQPSFYTVDFSDVGFCRKVLEAIADDENLLIDNDHGIIQPARDFLRLLRSRPSWDWRTD
jgi:hypothetical protein